MNMGWKKFWDILAWVCFGIVIIYFLLKAWGILHSPPLAETIAILSAGVSIGVYIKRIEDNNKNIEIINVKLSKQGEKMDRQENKLETQGKKLDSVINDLGLIKKDLHQINIKCPLFIQKV